MNQIKIVENPLPIDLAGNLLTISTSSPLPPGSRVNVELSSKNNSSNVRVTGKIVSIDSIGKASFKIKIRLHSVTKEQEELLSAILKEIK